MSPRTVDLLNIGLMLASLAAAFVLPFELFLFSYAVLGPLHYLTEISWLRERRFFLRGRWDWTLLAGVAVLSLVGTSYVLGRYHLRVLEPYSAHLIFVAFGLALVLALLESRIHRVLGALAVITLTLAFADVGAGTWFLFGLFVSTLVHVSLFTGAFMLYGALKSRSTTGYLATGVLLACSVVALVAPAEARSQVSAYVASSYRSFHGMNVHFARLLGLGDGSVTGSFAPFASYRELFTSPTGVVVMRFIAFAYTYHYLNWFSKTSIIGWHKVDKRMLAGALVIWIASLALYRTDYDLGARWLFLLSMAHVLLEFPLNHLSFVGIGRELAARVTTSPATR